MMLHRLRFNHRIMQRKRLWIPLLQSLAQALIPVRQDPTYSEEGRQGQAGACRLNDAHVDAVRYNVQDAEAYLR